MKERVLRGVNKMDEKQLWHYRYWDIFSDMTYSSTLNQSHLVGKGELLHSDEFIEISEDGSTRLYKFEHPDDHYFYKLSKGSKNYLLPRRFYHELPMEVSTWIDFKLSERDTKVWQFIRGYKSFLIPEKKRGTLKEFFKQFNPMAHSNLESWTILKAISIARGLKLAVCGDYGVGKNACYNIKSAIQNNCFSGMKNVSEAMFHKICLFNDDINVDEITTWKKDKLASIEDKIATFGDQSTKTHKHALDNKKANEMIGDVTGKSLIITFNPYDEKNHSIYFGENMGNPGKITDRFPFIFLPGRVLDSLRNPVKGEELDIVKENLKFYRENAMEFMYWRNHYHENMHGYDRGVADFNGRQLSNIDPLLDVLDAMSDSVSEFNYWVNVLNRSKQAYNRMINGGETLHSFSESKPFIEEEVL
jgi:hypothetical protein